MRDAENYGIEEAVVLWNIGYWCSINLSNHHNIHDGRVWMYQTRESFLKIFPYIASGKGRDARLKKMGRILLSLEKKGAITSKKLRKSKCSHTKWYSVTDLSSLSRYTKKADEHLKTMKGQICPFEGTQTVPSLRYKNTNINILDILESEADASDNADDRISVFIYLWKKAALSGDWPIKIKPGTNGHPIEYLGSQAKSHLSQYLEHCTPKELIKAMLYMAHQRSAEYGYRDSEHEKIETGLMWYLGEDTLIDCIQSVLNANKS